MLQSRFKEQENIWKSHPGGQTVIPKRIHQIWLGPAPLDAFREWMKSWGALHPDWEYTLWTERDLGQWTLTNQMAFDAATNYGEKSDIWRYEILERHGGVYVDIDFECLRPLDAMHEHDGCSFYAGLSNTNTVEVNNALIGVVPHHPILQALIASITVQARQDHLIAQYAGLPLSAMPRTSTIERTGGMLATMNLNILNIVTSAQDLAF
ncbi:Aste57867_10970 [Aphanomyces stellatus]|uniref:Aste57867_10970 protein n=1 Tax=Aphanomyces stellatus TaxID=120398 RepID=A0A485KRR7_9STRA|nr:hypothetical protein As57867_010929 [Aphanomyces stellatus]VFT87838.1 Aste57867_10970 [Aphanomyces stellatus]